MFKKMMALILACMLLAMCLLTGCDGENNTPTEPQKSNVKFEELVDFVIHAEEGKEFRILQLTDIQIGDLSTDRVPGRSDDTTPLTEEELYNDSFYYIEETVKQANPDLIIVTGDNIHGEFDDNGFCTEKLVAFMETLEIPWAPVFGNHDNETAKGVTWQCQQFEQAEHCLFKRGDITGNGNYTIGVEQGGKLIKVIYMMDSNGCALGQTYTTMPSFGEINQGENIRTIEGFGEDQLQWLDVTSLRITASLRYTPSKFVAFHIPLTEYYDALVSKGYLSSARQKIEINDPTGTDFGVKQEDVLSIKDPEMWELLKKHNFDGVFAGHDHLNNFSVVYENIRLTYGAKTGHFASYLPNMTGGTLITVAEGGEAFQVEHIFIPDRVAE